MHLRSMVVLIPQLRPPWPIVEHALSTEHKSSAACLDPGYALVGVRARRPALSDFRQKHLAEEIKTTITIFLVELHMTRLVNMNLPTMAYTHLHQVCPRPPLMHTDLEPAKIEGSLVTTVFVPLLLLPMSSAEASSLLPYTNCIELTIGSVK